MILINDKDMSTWAAIEVDRARMSPGVTRCHTLSMINLLLDKI